MVPLEVQLRSRAQSHEQNGRENQRCFIPAFRAGLQVPVRADDYFRASTCLCQFPHVRRA